MAVLVFKALHGQAPQCLTDDQWRFQAWARVGLAHPNLQNAQG